MYTTVHLPLFSFSHNNRPFCLNGMETEMERNGKKKGVVKMDKERIKKRLQNGLKIEEHVAYDR